MAENTKIEWCDHTFNPWIGCTKVSAGCAHCYAEKLDVRFGGGHWGKGAERKRTSGANWREPIKWNERAENMWTCACGKFHENYVTPPDSCPACGGKPHRWHPRVFCASLADWLDDEVPIEWLADLLTLIHRTPNLDWLLLTKRPQDFKDRLNAAYSAPGMGSEKSEMDWLWHWANGHGCIPPNVWIGTTVENQEMAERRIPELLKIPARVRFLSCEPLLGPVALRRAINPAHIEGNVRLEGIHWVIGGGESGPHARPMHPNWVRELRLQCIAAGVPFFFKQWGEWAAFDANPVERPVDESKLGYVDWFGKLYSVDRGPRSSYLVGRVGKKAAGRLLDRGEHNEFPEVRP